MKTGFEAIHTQLFWVICLESAGYNLSQIDRILGPFQTNIVCSQGLLWSHEYKFAKTEIGQGKA